MTILKESLEPSKIKNISPIVKRTSNGLSIEGVIKFKNKLYIISETNIDFDKISFVEPTFYRIILLQNGELLLQSNPFSESRKNEPNELFCLAYFTIMNESDNLDNVDVMVANTVLNPVYQETEPEEINCSTCVKMPEVSNERKSLIKKEEQNKKFLETLKDKSEEEWSMNDMRKAISILLNKK